MYGRMFPDMSQSDESRQAAQKRLVTWRRRVLSALMIVLVAGISIGLFVITQRDPDLIKKLGDLGYLGVFVASFVSSLSVILPVPGVLVVFPLVIALNPLLVALAGSTGGIIGEITGYTAGYGGQGMANKGRMYLRVEGWMKRYGVWTILVFAAVPVFPFDVAGLVAGALRFPLWKFMLVGWIGKTIKYIALVYAAFYSWKLLMPLLGGG